MDGVVAQWSMRTRLRSREPLLACFCIELASSAVADAFAQAGFDALIIDMEHSALAIDQVAAHVVACRAAGISPIVRVADDTRTALTRAADMWPAGIMVPGVGSVAEGEAIVDRLRYVPRGTRGVCPMLRYERIHGDRYRHLNDDLAIILQIEGADALQSAGAIGQLDDVDALFVGSYDLSHALGIPGEISHPRVLAAGRSVHDALSVNTALGAYVGGAEGAAAWASVGATFLAYTTDAHVLLAGARAAARAGRAALATTPEESGDTQ